MRQRHRVMTTHLCRSGAKHWRLRFWPPQYFLQHWTCCGVSSLHEALHPTVHSKSLVCNGCPFFFFFFFLVFSYLSVCLGKEWRLREQEAISFVCNQETLLVPYGWDQGTSALKSSRKKCSSKLVHISHKPKRGFAFPWVCVLADRSFWPEGGDRLTLEDPLSCSKWPRQLLINSSIP